VKIRDGIYYVGVALAGIGVGTAISLGNLRVAMTVGLSGLLLAVLSAKRW
jgi:hypothetical protein